MKATVLETKEAATHYNKVAAYLNAVYLSEANRSTYTAKQILDADRLKLGLESCYKGKVYLNYRQKFIAVKISAPLVVTDAAGLAVREDDWEKWGYVKKTTAQGIVYRIMRK